MEKCIIAPTVKDARTIASWLFAQGDMRGFLCRPGTKDAYLVVFDSYGETHHSMAMKLGLTSRRDQEDSIALIFRTDSTIYIDMLLRKNDTPEAVLGTDICAVLRKMYRGEFKLTNL